MRYRVYVVERLRPRALVIAGTGAVAAAVASLAGPGPDASIVAGHAAASVAARLDGPALILAAGDAAPDDAVATPMPAFEAALVEAVASTGPGGLAERIDGLVGPVDALRPAPSETPVLRRSSAPSSEPGAAPTDG